ncbi:unnamed protein product [Ixodes hexagonus]
MLVATALGASGTTLLRLALSLVNSPILALVFAVLPQGLLGGHVLTLASCYYAVTKNSNIRLLRTFRFFLLDVASLLGKAAGWLLGWLVHKTFGYQAALCSALSVQALILVVVWAQSPPADGNTAERDSAFAKVRMLLRPSNVKKAMCVFDRERHKDIKGTLKILFILMAVLSVMNYGW